MPMVLYTTEELIRDMVNAISSSEGRPVDIGGREHKNIDRVYLYKLVADTKRAVEGRPVSRRSTGAATKAPDTKRPAIPARACQAVAAAKASHRASIFTPDSFNGDSQNDLRLIQAKGWQRRPASNGIEAPVAIGRPFAQDHGGH